MEELDFYKKLGLKSNPFQYTNADEEDDLPLYFVAPPYFSSVWGDPTRPSSCVIFAPKGGGKSAQRRMIELRGPKKDVLTIKYCRFDMINGNKLANYNIDYHLKSIIRNVLIAFLLTFYEKELFHMSFSDTERRHIKTLCEYYLFDLRTDEIKNAVNSIMAPLDKAKEFLRRNLWTLNSMVDSIFIKFGIQATDKPNKNGIKIENPSKNHLEILIDLIQSIGYKSIYVLVDKVDETALTTNDAIATFNLVKSLLRDLDLLQMKGIGFKFFLWNETKPYYRKYARPDRIQDFDLNWTRDELGNMIRLRLKAYSQKDVLIDFHDLFDIEDKHKNLFEYIIITFSQCSPRDMIRICRRLIVEELRLTKDPSGISYEALSKGLNNYCEHRAKEIIPIHVFRDLIKTHRLDFTVNYVANEVFKIQTNSARAKIQTWLKTGVVQHIDDVQISSGKKPHHHYAVVDARVAKSIFPEMEFLNFMGEKVETCNKCGTDIFRDWDIVKTQTCQYCKNTITIN